MTLENCCMKRVTNFGPAPGRILPKTTSIVRDYGYFIHIKFNQNQSSGSGKEVKNVKSLLRTDGCTDDGWRTDDRPRLRWAKKCRLHHQWRNYNSNDQNSSIRRNLQMRRLRNVMTGNYQESVITGQTTKRRTDKQTPDLFLSAAMLYRWQKKCFTLSLFQRVDISVIIILSNLFISPESKAQVSYCHSAKSVVRL